MRNATEIVAGLAMNDLAALAFVEAYARGKPLAWKDRSWRVTSCRLGVPQNAAIFHLITADGGE